MSVDLYSVVAQIEGIEWIILLVIVAGVLLWGPQKLPEFARGVGRALGEFQRGRMEIEREIRGQFSGSAALSAAEPATRVDRAASALGLSPAGLAEGQLRILIARSLDKATDEQVSAAARALGVLATGGPSALLRDQVLKALAE